MVTSPVTVLSLAALTALDWRVLAQLPPPVVPPSSDAETSIAAAGLPDSGPLPQTAIARPETADPIFSDIRGHWAEPYIMALVDQKLVLGFTDGTFRPDAAITPAHLQAMRQQIKQTYGVEIDSDRPITTRAEAAALLYQALATPPQPLVTPATSRVQRIANTLPLASPPSIAPPESAPALPTSSLTPPLDTLTDANQNRDLSSYWRQLCQMKTPNPAEALAACDQWLKLNPQQAEIWLIRGDLLVALQQYAKAAASYQQVLRLQPETASVQVKRCQVFTELNQTDDAVAACDRAIALDKNWEEKTPALAWYLRGAALKRAGRNQEAIAAFERAVTLLPSYSLAWTDYCRALSELGKQGEAIGACNQALSVNGEWGDRSAALAWYNRGLALARSGQYEQAIAAYDRALAINPKDASVWVRQGLVLAQLRRPVEALTAYDQAIKASPNYSLALVNRCVVLNQLGQYEAAIAACEQATTADTRWEGSEIAQVWDQRGQALAGLGRLEEALAAANRAVAQKPDYAEAWSNQSVILWRMKRYETALAATQRAVALKPDYASAWFNQGRILRSLKRDAQAVAAYDRALQASSATTDRALMAEIWTNRSVALWHLAQYPQALASADQAIGVKADYAQGWFNRGVVLMALRQPSQAIAAYDRALRLEPKDPYAWTGKGLALNQLGKYPEALVALEMALKLDPNQPLVQQNRDQVLQRLTPRSPTPTL